MRRVLPLDRGVPLYLTPRVVGRSPSAIFHQVVLCGVLVNDRRAFRRRDKFCGVNSVVLATREGNLANFAIRPVYPRTIVAINVLITRRAGGLRCAFDALFANSGPTFCTSGSDRRSRSQPAGNDYLNAAIAPFVHRSKFEVNGVPGMARDLLLGRNRGFIIEGPLLLFLSQGRVGEM